MNVLKVSMQPYSGLCNRLWVLFSYYNYAIKNNLKLQICWLTNSVCDAHFLDFFKPLINVEFINEDKQCDVYTHLWHKDYNPYYTYIYQDLELNDSMTDLIKTLNWWSSNYNAIHVRSTIDFINDLPLRGLKNMEFSMFDGFINTSNLPCFLASDKHTTQQYFTLKYTNLFYYNTIQLKDDIHNVRHTDIQHAIIDLVSCVKAKRFLGTPHSSFSATINTLRRNKTRLLF